ncbi:MAG: TRAP transporter small permease subunit [Alphaproteobacteria bacterium]|nr:TRAP transporter small permease subunit [Alphaproteobacteria bacterium]
MPKLVQLERWFEQLLEVVVMLLTGGMAVVVLLAVVFRKAGMSLVWYDEVASIMLAWLTYYGASLAALKRAHIGFPGLVESFPPRWRVTAVYLGEIVTIGFFALLAWVGWEVLVVLEGSYLISLPNVPIQFTQSVIPIGAVLFIVAQLLSLPRALDEARRGVHHQILPEVMDK